MFILRSFRNLSRLIRAPFDNFGSFLRTNPLSRGARLAQGAGKRLNYFRTLPGHTIRRYVPKRFRVASRNLDDNEDDRDLPPEEVAKRGGRSRARRGRRIKIARRVDFTQVHLISQATGMRQVVHVGSTVGTSHAEWVMNPTARQPVRLQFVRGEGTPLVASLLAAPRDTSLMVDNVPARPTVPIHNGSLLNVDGISYTIELVAGGSLPAVTRVDAAWATNIGPRRDINQDAIGIYQHPDAYLFAVADGVGGGYAGEEVSAYAVKYLQSVFKRNIPYDNLSWYEIFGTAYDYINREVRNWVQHTPQPAGTTLTALTIRSWTATVAHVGDSRLYLLRHGNLRQITTDHNDNVPVETRNRAGYPVTIERSVLQKAIGKTNTISPDVTTFSLQPGDRLLLTTDGVTNQITDDELREVLATSSLSSIPDDLVELSNTRDNKDNASVIALEVLAESYERDTWVADPDDRVYVGGPAWYLELRPPQEMNTVYSAITGTGCLLLLIALMAFGAVWGGGRFAMPWTRNPMLWSIQFLAQPLVQVQPSRSRLHLRQTQRPRKP
jgi:serine/threonine protein phosphatase PrpC